MLIRALGSRLRKENIEKICKVRGEPGDNLI